MSQASFDTYAAIRKLERAGCSVRQAEAMVSMVVQATGVTLQMAKDLEHTKLQVDATKNALASLRAEMQAGFASLDARFVSLGNRQEQVERTMVTKGELYRALWVQGGVLATLILTLAGAMLGFSLYLLTGS